MFTIPGYILSDEIYRSARSLVYKAKRKADNLPVVIKTLNEEYPSSTSIAKLQNEYHLMKELEHVYGVVKVYALESYSNNLAIIEEDFEAQPVANIIKEGERISINVFFGIATELVKIIGDLHQHQLIHKDINPRNILWNEKTNEIKISDFGISSKLSRERPDINTANQLEGSLPYISPEQTGRMNRELDYRTDYYSLGVTFYELLTGILPFHAEDAMGWVHCHIAKVPMNPCTVNPEIPEILAEIIYKLMSKNAEDRYLSSHGLIMDLEKCREEYQIEGQIKPFKLGQWDISEKFQVSQKLYGREKEITILLNQFENVANGEKQLMFVAGYSGVGKTVLIKEVQRSIVQKRGRFIEGKFDQFQKDIPYSALTQAFQGLFQQLLSEPEKNLVEWKAKLVKALGANGQIIIDIIPNLEQITGSQPAVEELNPNEAQNRLQITFRKFINVFASKDHPLVIFLDDLQWSDTPSLKLIESLLISEEINSLFIICAYRDNEVNEGHPLLTLIDDLKKNTIFKKNPFQQIFIQPLLQTSVNLLIADTLYKPFDQIKSLSDLIFQKTEGNPFFINELLKNIYREKCISFLSDEGSWDWDIDKIKNAEISANVVEFMISRLKKLESKTQELLQLASCIGNSFDLHTLSLIDKASPAQTAASLWEAMKQEIIVPLNDQYRLLHGIETSNALTAESDEAKTAASELGIVYKFQHDRIQQAAYSLIEENKKEEVHLQIGKLILNNTTEDELDDKIIEIVRHLNEGKNLIKEDSERNQLAVMNLKAGKKAKQSSAFIPAFRYVNTGMEFLPENPWETNYELTFDMYKNFSECAYLSGEIELADKYSNILLDKAKTPIEKAEIHQMRLVQFTFLGKLNEAISECITGLKLLGIKIPAKVTMLTVLKEAALARLYVGRRNISDLINLPITNDPGKKLAHSILTELGPAAVISGDDNMMALAALKQANLSMREGHSPSSAFAYIFFGFILGGAFNNLKSGYEFASLGLKLNEKFNSVDMDSKVITIYSIFVHHWNYHWKTIDAYSQKAMEASLQSGDLRYICYSTLFTSLWSEQNNLYEAIKQGEKIISILSETRYVVFINAAKIIVNYAKNLIGQTTDRTSLSNSTCDELLCLQEMESSKSSVGIYYITKLKTYYMYENYSLAYDTIPEIRKYINALISLQMDVFYCLYSVLTLTAIYPELNYSKRRSAWRAIKKEYRRMRRWAKHCPANFLHHKLLMEAEIARITNKISKAENLYDKAIEAAITNEYLSYEALANELTGKFYLSLKRDNIASLYMNQARYLYSRWGATEKIKFLEETYPQLLTKKITEDFSVRVSNTASYPSITIGTGDNYHPLDVSSISKATQALSGEIEFDKLLIKMINILKENAGADKCIIILPEEITGKKGEKLESVSGLIIQAESIRDQDVKVMQAQPVEKSDNLSISLVQYVARSNENVVLGDALHRGQFTNDSYIQNHKLKSVLCMPVINQGKLVAIIYMENNMATEVFTVDRIEVLSILSAQVAISIENALLYENMKKALEQEKELNLALIARAKAEKANMMKTELLSMAAHDLKNPLNSILGFSKLISKENTKETRTGDFANTIVKASQGMLDLINHLLNYSAIETGRINIDTTIFRLNDVVSFLIKEMDSLAQSKKQQIIFNESEKDLIVNADPARIKEAMENLLSNAVKYSYLGKSIWVNLKKVNGKALIEVVDEGPGLSENDKKKLFGKFQKLSAVPTGGETSTGLGLSIVKQLVELQNGTIEVESTLGKGSTFRIVLPALDPEKITDVIEIKEKPKSEEFISIKFEPATIIIVDDMSESRTLIKEMLGDQEFTIFEGASGKDLLEITEKVIPDLILSDIHMPEMSGFEVIKKIKASQKLKDIPVIAVTSETREKVQDAGFDNHVQKPVKYENLIEVIKNYLSEIEYSPEEVKTDSSTISEQDIERIEHIRNEFDSQILSMYKEIEATMDIAEIESFAKIISQFGSQNNLLSLSELGKILTKDVENFNIENIKKILTQFSRFST